MERAAYDRYAKGVRTAGPALLRIRQKMRVPLALPVPLPWRRQHWRSQWHPESVRFSVAKRVLTILALVLAVLSPASSRAQFREAVPRTTYYLAIDDLYAGEYRSAEKGLRRETNRGVRTVQARWIDSICHHALLGEVLFNQGRNAEALAEFDQACQILLTYPNWLLRVKFQQAPRPDPNLARQALPWGQSGRRFVLGQFPDTLPVFMGQLDNSQVIRQGGVVSMPQMWRVNAIEIVRASALAMRRRNEILGPLGKYDPISKELADVFSRGGLAPPNHWSSAWIDLQRGIALAGVGKEDEALAVLERAIVINGQFDHPLTCVALFEQGQIAFRRGDGQRAAKLLAEASFSAFYYQDRDVITESLLLGWVNHIAQGGQGVYPPLPSAVAWAHGNRLQHIAVKLRLAEAESLLWSGQSAAGAAAIEDANRRIGDMRSGLPGIHSLYLQSIAQLLQGRIEPSGALVEQALAAQANASLRNFQIVRTGDLFDSRQASPRVAAQLYESLLADPAPVDWVLSPLDSMAVLQTRHDAAFDRWLIAALERKEVSLALEVSEQAKRRRFLAGLPLGGRLLALRTILEAPLPELSSEGVLQRQQFLTSFPGYRQLAAGSDEIYRKLRASSVIPSNGGESRALADQYETWGKNARARERVLLELALRRVPSSLEFPPLRKTADLQKLLGEGEALVEFHVAAGGVYGFIITSSDAHLWQLGDEKQLWNAIGTLLRELGNYGPNKTFSPADLVSDKWRDATREMFDLVFADARLDLEKTESLVIVPDGVLWYLPFELLVTADDEATKLLSEQAPIRYGPTAALAMGDRPAPRRIRHTGIVANSLSAEESPAGGEVALQELEAVTTGPVRLPSPLPEPAGLVAPLLDTLIVLDDVAPRDAGGGWSLLPRSKGKGNALESWFGLPYGGPQRIVVTGLATAAEQGLKGTRRNGARGVEPGDEMFRNVCAAMAGGARTVLLSRWRTGGRTNLDLVREFVQELPHSSATDAWRRATVLAREAPLDATREPRLKGTDEGGELPTADHPFFWAGYMLVDTGSQPAAEEAAAEEKAAEDQKKKNDENVKGIDKVGEGKKNADADESVPPPKPEFEAPAVSEGDKDVPSNGMGEK